MSNPSSPIQTTCPWLAVEIEHRFKGRSPGFHLRVAFEAHAARTVIFGPSGSGKSSLLRAIAGLLEADSGRIQLHGETIWQRMPGVGNSHSIRTEKRRVGLVMQNPAVFPHLTVERNVGFALGKSNKSEREEEVRRLLQMVGAEPLAGQWPRELSGGQLQRVAVARTLAADPLVLLLDEPFAALDAESRQQLSRNLHAWARQRSVPVLTVTHNLEEAFSSGDEILSMKEGRILAQGKPHEVLAEERGRLLRALGALPIV